MRICRSILSETGLSLVLWLPLLSSLKFSAQNQSLHDVPDVLPCNNSENILDPVTRPAGSVSILGLGTRNVNTQG